MSIFSRAQLEADAKAQADLYGIGTAGNRSRYNWRRPNGTASIAVYFVNQALMFFDTNIDHDIPCASYLSGNRAVPCSYADS
ncbi:MAG: hypothetical protein SFW64_02360 [Alphaproteobacteria bacterium]|nr:hypothetical protein [Alphaproteobacteria bacterium]